MLRTFVFFWHFCDFYFVCYCSALIRYCLLRHALCQLSSFDQTSSFHISHHTHLAPHAGLPDIVFDQLDHKEDDGNEWIYLCVKLLCWTCTFKFQWCCQIDVAELNPFLKFTSTHCLPTVRNVSCQSSLCAPQSKTIWKSSCHSNSSPEILFAKIVLFLTYFTWRDSATDHNNNNVPLVSLCWRSWNTPVVLCHVLTLSPSWLVSTNELCYLTRSD